MSNRLSRAQELLRQNTAKYDGFFVSKPENRSYLSGFTGSYGYLLISQNEGIILTDGRYITQAEEQAPGWKVEKLVRPYEECVANILKKAGLQRLAFESDHLTVAEYNVWSQIAGIEWVATRGIFSSLRRYKDPDELARLQRAVDIADKAFEHILNFIKPGLTERQVAAELEFAMRREGADAIAFDTIIASGWRGALPHGRASDKIIAAGDLVTLDFGANFESYNSDVTRTIAVGHADERQRQLYDLVLRAQLASCAAVRPGAICKAVDAVARDMFTEAGYGEFFVHGLGHNLGREVHEQPILSIVEEAPLEAGMVLTIEPGLYVSGFGGVRIEDDLFVTADGAQILSHSPKELLII